MVASLRSQTMDRSIFRVEADTTKELLTFEVMLGDLVHEVESATLKALMDVVGKEN